MFQVYRQRVTHLKSDEGSGVKDERKQRRECKAESEPEVLRRLRYHAELKLQRKWGLLSLNPVQR